MAKCSRSGDSASILKSGGRSPPTAGASLDISSRSFTAASHSNLALQHRTLIYRRFWAGTADVTVLDKEGLQGLYVVTERPDLIIRVKQGLEAGNGEPVLEMGAKQGLEEGNGEPVLGMGAKQGLEEGNREPVLGMGVKQGLEEGNREPVLGMGAE